MCNLTVNGLIDLRKQPRVSIPKVSQLCPQRLTLNKATNLQLFYNTNTLGAKENCQVNQGKQLYSGNKSILYSCKT